MLRFIGALLAVVPSGASAQILWQNVSVGMAVSDVAHAQPTAKRPDNLSRLGDGSTCDLKIDRIEVGSEVFSACFYFTNQKLSEVMLTEIDDPSIPSLQEITTLLRAKYGQEISSQKTSLGYDVEWMTSDRVNISITYFDQLPPSLLNITYQVRLAKESSKL